MYHKIWENVIMYLFPIRQTVLTPNLSDPGNFKNTLIFGLPSRQLPMAYYEPNIRYLERLFFHVCLHRVTVVGNLTQLISILFLIHLRINSWYLCLLSLSLESLWGSAKKKNSFHLCDSWKCSFLHSDLFFHWDTSYFLSCRNYSNFLVFWSFTPYSYS